MYRTHKKKGKEWGFLEAKKYEKPNICNPKNIREPIKYSDTTWKNWENIFGRHLIR